MRKCAVAKAPFFLHSFLLSFFLGWDIAFMLTFAFIYHPYLYVDLWYHPYLVCTLFGMPSLHLFTFLMFISLDFALAYIPGNDTSQLACHHHQTQLVCHHMIVSELLTHHSAGTSPVFSNMRCTTLLPECTGAAPKLKSTKALVCMGTLRRMLCRVAMA